MPHRSACQPLAPSFPHTWRPWGTWTSPLGAASRPLTGESTPPFSSCETGTQIGCCCSASHQPLPTWLPTAPIKVRNWLLLGKRLTYCQWWGPSATEQNWTNHTRTDLSVLGALQPSLTGPRWRAKNSSEVLVSKTNGCRLSRLESPEPGVGLKDGGLIHFSLSFGNDSVQCPIVQNVHYILNIQLSWSSLK